MSEWIKVDAEHMPPDMKFVLVTTKFNSEREVLAETRWNEQRKVFEHRSDDDIFIEVYETVTHWMPYPAPAQD